jgi:hypothetical protein
MMTPYGAYQLYQIERPKSAAELRRADEQLGELSRAVSSAWHSATQPTRVLIARAGHGRSRIRTRHAGQSRPMPSSPSGHSCQQL